MSAIDTAQRVLAWATLADERSRRPPQGDVFATEQLAQPPAAVRTALAQLTAVTLARLRFNNPPLGDSRAVTLGGAVLAAAIGVAGIAPEVARRLLGAMPPVGGALDWVARHGVVAPALTMLPPAMAEDCRQHSPLTALYERPAPGQEGAALALMSQLLAHPVERAAFTLHLAQPTADPTVRRWRTELLNRLRLGNEGEARFVLDVYETLLIHYPTTAQDQVKAARAVLSDPAAASQEPRLQDALSVARWWGPLWALERSHPDSLRGRWYLGHDYREGLKLFRLAQRLTGEAL